MKPIILFSGPEGAGKTAVARELVASSAHPMACIEGDTFWFFIARNAAAQGRMKNFKMIMIAMTAAALPYALYGYEVIVEFSIPPWFLDTARNVVKSKEVAVAESKRAQLLSQTIIVPPEPREAANSLKATPDRLS